MIDVCSSGQGYLVSAGPAISSVIPPLFSSHVSHPHIPYAESAVESSARETLGMLMTSPISACLKPVIVLPQIDGTDENMSIPPVSLLYLIINPSFFRFQVLLSCLCSN